MSGFGKGFLLAASIFGAAFLSTSAAAADEQECRKAELRDERLGGAHTLEVLRGGRVLAVSDIENGGISFVDIRRPALPRFISKESAPHPLAMLSILKLSEDEIVATAFQEIARYRFDGGEWKRISAVDFGGGEFFRDTYGISLLDGNRVLTGEREGILRLYDLSEGITETTVMRLSRQLGGAVKVAARDGTAMVIFEDARPGAAMVDISSPARARVVSFAAEKVNGNAIWWRGKMVILVGHENGRGGIWILDVSDIRNVRIKNRLSLGGYKNIFFGDFAKSELWMTQRSAKGPNYLLAVDLRRGKLSLRHNIGDGIGAAGVRLHGDDIYIAHRFSGAISVWSKKCLQKQENIG